MGHGLTDAVTVVCGAADVIGSMAAAVVVVAAAWVVVTTG